MTPIESADFGVLAAIAAMAVATYAMRAGGFWLMQHVPPSARLRQMLNALPGSVIVARRAADRRARRHHRDAGDRRGGRGDAADAARYRRRDRRHGGRGGGAGGRLVSRSQSDAAPEPRQSVRRVVCGCLSRTVFRNRGGRFHTDEQTLTQRRWVSRTWICCVLEFKNRHRDVWGRSYTELFFLDEVTALAAGHRPCFECRRKMPWPLPFCGVLLSSSAPGRTPARWMMYFTASASTAAPSDGIGSRATICRWRLRCAGEGRVRGTRRLAAAVDSGGLHGPLDAAARQHCRRAHAARLLAVLPAGYRPQWHPSAGRGL